MSLNKTLLRLRVSGHLVVFDNIDLSADERLVEVELVEWEAKGGPSDVYVFGDTAAGRTCAFLIPDLTPVDVERGDAVIVDKPMLAWDLRSSDFHRSMGALLEK